MFMPELKLITVRFKDGCLEVVPEGAASTAEARAKYRKLRAEAKAAFFQEVEKFQKDQKHKDSVWAEEFEVEEIEDTNGVKVPVASYYSKTWDQEFWLYQPLTDALDPDGDYSFHSRKREHKYTPNNNGSTVNSTYLRNLAELYGEVEDE